MNGPNPFADIGLPPTWAPAPCTFAVAKVEARGIDGAQTWHVLRFDTPYGVQGFAVDDDAARRMIDALTEQVGGIAVARTLPANGNGKG